MNPFKVAASVPEIARANVLQSTVEAVITRADGTVEDLGMISYWHRNPLRRLAWSLRQLAKRKRT